MFKCPSKYKGYENSWMEASFHKASSTTTTCTHKQSISHIDQSWLNHNIPAQHWIYFLWSLVDSCGNICLKNFFNQWLFLCSIVPSEDWDGTAGDTEHLIRSYLNRCNSKQTYISGHDKANISLNRMLLRSCCKVLLDFQVNICCLIVSLCLN